jgi:very-short-patch-repair endonuclease
MAGPMKRLGGIARGQHGLVSREQALRVGLSDVVLHDWVGHGRLERVHAGVYRVGGAPRRWEQEVMAAVLAGDGVASHRCAAHLWGLHDDNRVEVTVPRERRARANGVVVHRSKDLVGRHCTRRTGIPVTTPMRTLVDLGAVVGDEQVADALERALIARVCSVAAVERALDDVARKGRRGAGVIRRVLDERALGRARPEGLLEARLARVLREHGLPAPAFQHHVRVRGRLVARVDFAYPDVLLAIEVDGFEVHATPAAMQADLERQNRLVAAGWTVLRFTWLDVVRRPAWVAAQIKAVLLTVSRAA